MILIIRIQYYACTGIPDVPDRPSIRERPRGGSIELRWTGTHTNSTGLVSWGKDSQGTKPVLYIVESRWNIGRLQNEADMSSWQQITQVSPF